MTFLSDIRQWQDSTHFREHVFAHDAAIAPWIRGVTIHHTYRPLPTQWRGYESMVGLREYYRAKGWNAGPHLFLAIGASKRAHDGIWQLTPLNVRGIHAGPCNASTIGIEVVGDYDRVMWSTALQKLVFDTIVTLLQWQQLPVNAQTVRAHRECMPGEKTCPGSAIDMTYVRTALSNYVAQKPSGELINDTLSVMGAPLGSQERVTRWFLAKKSKHYTEYDVANVIIPGYWQECVRLGIRPEVALAQMAHETDALRSWWCARPRRNPAGIGVTGVKLSVAQYAALNHSNKMQLYTLSDDKTHYVAGLSFPHWQASIRNHLAHLLRYATQVGQRTTMQQHYIDTARHHLPLTWHGSAPTLRALGHAHNPVGAGWAKPGTLYGAAIAAKIVEMTQ